MIGIIILAIVGRIGCGDHLRSYYRNLEVRNKVISKHGGHGKGKRRQNALILLGIHGIPMVTSNMY